MQLEKLIKLDLYKDQKIKSQIEKLAEKKRSIHGDPLDILSKHHDWLRDHNFTSEEILSIIKNTGGVGALDCLCNQYDVLTKNGLTKDEIIKIAKVKGGKNNLVALVNSYNELKKYFSHAQIVILLSNTGGSVTLDKLGANINNLNRILTNKQITSICCHKGGSNNIDAFINNYEKFIEEYYNKDMSYIDNFIRIIAHEGGSKNLEAFYKIYPSLKNEFSLTQIIQIVGNIGGSLSLEKVKNKLHLLTEYNFTKQQIVQIVNRTGGAKNLQQVIDSYKDLVGLRLTTDNIVKLSSHKGGAEIVKYFIEIQPELNNLSNEYKLMLEEVLQIMGHLGGRKNIDKYIYAAKQGKIKKSKLLKVGNNIGGSHNIDSLVELSEIQSNTIDLEGIFNASGGHKAYKTLIRLQSDLLKKYAISQKNLMQIAKRDGGAQTLEVMNDLFNDLKAINIKDLFEMANVNAGAQNLRIASKALKEIKFLQTSAIIKILKKFGGAKIVESIIENIEDIKKLKITPEELETIVSKRYSAENLKTFIKIYEKIKNKFSHKQIILIAKHGDDNLECALKCFSDKNYADLINKYNLTASQLTALLAVKGGSINILCLLQNIEKLIQQFTVDQIISMMAVTSGYTNIPFVLNYIQSLALASSSEILNDAEKPVTPQNREKDSQCALTTGGVNVSEVPTTPQNIKEIADLDLTDADLWNSHPSTHVYIDSAGLIPDKLILNSNQIVSIVSRVHGGINLDKLITHYKDLISYGFTLEQTIEIASKNQGGRSIAAIHENHSKLQKILGTDNLSLLMPILIGFGSSGIINIKTIIASYEDNANIKDHFDAITKILNEYFKRNYPGRWINKLFIALNSNDKSAFTQCLNQEYTDDLEKTIRIILKSREKIIENAASEEDNQLISRQDIVEEGSSEENFDYQLEEVYSTSTSTSTSASAGLTNFLNQNNLSIYRIPGDGHCFFNAVSLHVGLDVTTLRVRIGDYILDNQNYYINFIENVPLQQYVNNVKNDIWGGNIEIDAIERIFGRPLIVIGPNGEDRTTYHNSNTFASDPIYIYFNGENHYDALLQNENLTNDIITSNTRKTLLFSNSQETNEPKNKKHKINTFHEETISRDTPPPRYRR